MTGYLIVAAVFAGSIGLAALLGRKGLEVRDQRSEVSNQNPSTSQPPSVPQLFDVSFPFSAFRFPKFFLPTFYFLSVLSWIVLVEVVAEAWYRSHELNMIPRVHWTARWPESTPGFREIRIEEGIRSTLRFDEGREASWPLSNETPRRELESKLIQSHDERRGLCSLFFFRWNPGTSTILRARAHRPDICLPNTGWKILTDDRVRNYRIVQDFALPFRHFSFVRDIANQPRVFAHAFFGMREDFVLAKENSVTQFDLASTPTHWGLADRYRVVREGLRNPGQQVMELVIMTPRQVSDEDAETEFATMAPQIIRISNQEGSK